MCPSRFVCWVLSLVPLGIIALAAQDAKWIAQDQKPEQVQTLRLKTVQGVNVPGEIKQVGQMNWYSVETLQDGWLKVHCGGVGKSKLDPFIVVYDKQRKKLTSNDDAVSTDAQVHWKVKARETYLILVTGVGPSTGTYGLLVSQPRTQRLDDFPDTKEDADPVVFNAKGEAVIEGSIAWPHDNDWFVVELDNDARVLITIEPAPGSKLDTHLRLHDQNRLMEQHNDKIERKLRASEKYWLHVRPGGDSLEGAKNIRKGFQATGKYILKLSLK